METNEDYKEDVVKRKIVVKDIKQCSSCCADCDSELYPEYPEFIFAVIVVRYLLGVTDQDYDLGRKLH